MKRLAGLTLTALAILLVAHSAPAESLRNQREGPSPRSLKLPVIVDGIRYEPDEMERFGNQTMYWVYDEAARRQGVIFAFTTPEAAQAYGRQPGRDLGSRFTEKLVRGNSCSFLHPAVNAGPGDPYDWLILCPLQQISTLRDGYNDRLSYVEAGDNGYYTVLYWCYNFDPNCSILWVAPGNTISDLNSVGMNNVTSSIRFCRNVDPFSCAQ